MFRTVTKTDAVSSGSFLSGAAFSSLTTKAAGPVGVVGVVGAGVVGVGVAGVAGAGVVGAGVAGVGEVGSGVVGVGVVGDWVDGGVACGLPQATMISNTPMSGIAINLVSLILTPLLRQSCPDCLQILHDLQ